MNGETVPLFRVLVLSLPDSPQDLAPAFSEQLGLNLIDARIQIHHLPGLLKPSLDRSAADRLTEEIHKAGGYAVVVNHELVPDLSHPTPLHHVRCVDEGLEIVSLEGERQLILDWNELTLLNIGVLPLEITRHENVDVPVVHSAPHSQDVRTEIQTMRGPEAWLIADDPLRCWVIKQTEMNYEYLGERMQTSASLNFRLLIDDIIARAKHLYLTPPARAFTGHGLFRHYAFDSDDELRENTLFHLLICRRMHNDDKS
ncbi:MAG TPA: hypothetical protein VLA12_01210 [Planctomycetaceae bacterium]|nr:hypothetical protein [Planctomycetaceae bacterium]